MKFFSVGEQATKQARKLKKEKGISVTPSNYNREGLDKETQNVLNSLREMMSVVCVQLKKIVLTSETKMVQKRRLRKHFFSANISQIYANFKVCNWIFYFCPPAKEKKKTLWLLFYGWGSSASRLQPLRGGYLLYTTKSPEISGTHFIDLRRMKGWVKLGATQWFWTLDLEIQHLNH